MNKIDNKTPFNSNIYDKNIRMTLPFYKEFYTETADIIKTITPTPRNWLDTGCGTSHMIEVASKEFVNTNFYISDPSKEMIEISEQKLNQNNIKHKTLGSHKTEDIPDSYNNKFNVITAILSHHYLNKNERTEAFNKCYDLLENKGVFVNFEITKPTSDTATKISIERWKNAQISMGKTEDQATKHLSRYGKEYYPITLNEHISLLKQSGFKTIELFWLSHMQAGFYAIK